MTVDITNTSNSSNSSKDNEIKRESNDIIIKSVVNICGKKMIYGSWLSKSFYSNNISVLEDMNL